jgi:hypothetical protein
MIHCIGVIWRIGTLFPGGASFLIEKKFADNDLPTMAIIASQITTRSRDLDRRVHNGSVHYE